MTRPIRLAIVAIVLLTIAACAAGSSGSHQAAAGGAGSQLILGFWHGLIAPVTLLVEVLRRLLPGVLPATWSWRLYETAAASVPYDVGFYFGVAGGPSLLWSRRRG